MSTFEEAVAFLNEKDIPFRQGDEYVGEVGKGRHKEDRPWIESLHVPFTPEEWLDIISADSELFGSFLSKDDARKKRPKGSVTAASDPLGSTSVRKVASADRRSRRWRRSRPTQPRAPS